MKITGSNHKHDIMRQEDIRTERTQLKCYIFSPFLWGGELMLKHFPPSSYLQGTSCKCWEKTQPNHELDQWHSTGRSNNCVPFCTIRWLQSNLLFHRDLAILVGVKRKADISGIGHKGLIVQWPICTWWNKRTLWRSLTFSPGILVCTCCFLQRCRQSQECHLPSSDGHLITNTKSLLSTWTVFKVSLVSPNPWWETLTHTKSPLEGIKTIVAQEMKVCVHVLTVDQNRMLE